MNGLDAAQGFESGKEHSYIFMKDSLENDTLEANQLCDRME